MKLSDEEICGLVRSEIGEDCTALVELIKGKKHISEFKLADKLKITVNQVRNILYRLQEKNLVDFIRKKDKKKGWYIYYWTFDIGRAKALILNLKKKKLNELRVRLDNDKDSYFFSCPSECVKYRFEEALECQFKCPECDQVMVQEDNIKKMEQVRKDIIQLETDLIEIEETKTTPKKVERKTKKKSAQKKIKKLKPSKKRKVLRKIIVRKLKKKAKRKINKAKRKR